MEALTGGQPFDKAEAGPGTSRRLLTGSVAIVGAGGDGFVTIGPTLRQSKS